MFAKSNELKGPGHSYMETIHCFEKEPKRSQLNQMN